MTQGFRTILFAVFLGFLVIFASNCLFSNYSPILSYEVTDQNSEGVFSSLSRDFDKTIEEISNNDNRESGDQDTPTSTSTNTQNSNERILNSTSTSDTTSSNNDVSNTTTTTS